MRGTRIIVCFLLFDIMRETGANVCLFSFWHTLGKPESEYVFCRRILMVFLSSPISTQLLTSVYGYRLSSHFHPHLRIRQRVARHTLKHFWPVKTIILPIFLIFSMTLSTIASLNNPCLIILWAYSQRLQSWPRRKCLRKLTLSPHLFLISLFILYFT